MVPPPTGSPSLDETPHPGLVLVSGECILLTRYVLPDEFFKMSSMMLVGCVSLVTPSLNLL